MAPKNLENVQLELKDSIERLKCLEVVVVSSRNGDIRFLCRCYDEPLWLQVMSTYLEREGNWYSFIGKKYFLDKGKLKFGWAIVFESDDLNEASLGIRKLLSEILSELKSENVKEFEDADGVIEVPLPFRNPYMERAAERRVRSTL